MEVLSSKKIFDENSCDQLSFSYDSISPPISSVDFGPSLALCYCNDFSFFLHNFNWVSNEHI